MRSFKVLAALLDYPTEETIAYLPVMQTVLVDEGRLSEPLLSKVVDFIDELADGDLLDLQAAWVDQFDRTRSLSLNMFEHVHGESRDRGQAMVDLKALYERHGLVLDSRELPDYLPVLLEFLSQLDEREAIEILGEPAHVIAVLAERLQNRCSDYAPVMAAIAHLAGADASLAQPLSTPDVDEDLDTAWAEEALTFGAGSALGGCPAATPPAPGR